MVADPGTVHGHGPPTRRSRHRSLVRSRGVLRPHPGRPGARPRARRPQPAESQAPGARARPGPPHHERGAGGRPVRSRPAGLRRGAASAKGAPLDVVVNGAGFGFYGAFVDQPLEGEVGQVKVNALALLTLSHAALRSMVPRGTGGLLNVASIAGFAPTPRSATYSATKAFVIYLTEALHDEVAPLGVHVTALCPGFTRTNFQQRAGVATSGVPGFAWSEPGPVVEPGAHGPRAQPGAVRAGAREQGDGVHPAPRAPGHHTAGGRAGDAARRVLIRCRCRDSPRRRSARRERRSPRRIPGGAGRRRTRRSWASCRRRSASGSAR